LINIGIGGSKHSSIRGFAKRTFDSLLIQHGESLTCVRDQMGHRSIAVTLDIYGHLVPGGNRTAVDRLDDWIASRRIPRASTAVEARSEYDVNPFGMSGEPPRNRPCLASPKGEANLAAFETAKPRRASREVRPRPWSAPDPNGHSPTGLSVKVGTLNGRNLTADVPVTQ
jgi:hypothetical protein